MVGVAGGAEGEFPEWRGGAAVGNGARANHDMVMGGRGGGGDWRGMNGAGVGKTRDSETGGSNSEWHVLEAQASVSQVASQTRTHNRLLAI